jgi:hypothetical protein
MRKDNTAIKLLSACLAGMAATLGYAYLVRPRILGWGSKPEEIASPMPGDELIHNPLTETTRAVDIDAAVEDVWPWIVQIGQGRGGFYSYEWLENIFGLDIHNADQVLPEYQDLAAGDLIPFWQGVGVTVRQILPPQLLVLAGSFNPQSEEVGGSWTFTLKEIDTTKCRLTVRTRIAAFPPHCLGQFISFKIIEPSHFIMERGMLLGIKKRAEKANRY